MRWRPQQSPPSTGGTTWAARSSSRRPAPPQRSPPSTGGTTWAARSSSRRPAPPQRSPPSTGGTTRMSPWSGSTTPGLNGARPVRAGRRRERGFAGQLCDLASTEPAQYGRDDDAAYAGGCFRRRFFASTEPAQYGRDDQSPSGSHRQHLLPQRSPPSTGGTTVIAP